MNDTAPTDLLATHETPLGTVFIAISPAGLRGLWFDGQKHFENQKKWQNTHFVQHPRHNLLLKTQHWLDDYFSPMKRALQFLPIAKLEPSAGLASANAPFPGRAPKAGLAAPVFCGPLDLSSGTPFQQAVWQALLRIGSGDTATYGAVAHAIARPKAVRAVGAAVGRNPISIIVPCHRVLGANGTLTGYAGGLDRKMALLTLEGAMHRPETTEPLLI